MSESAPLTDTVPLRAHVAEEVRALLGRRRMTNVELAAQLGKSRTYVGRRLSGETAFDLDDLEHIARILRVRVGQLLPDRPGASSPCYTPIVQTGTHPINRPPDNRPVSGPPLRETIHRPQRRSVLLPAPHATVNSQRLPV